MGKIPHCHKVSFVCVSVRGGSSTVWLCSPPGAVELLEWKPTVAVKVLLDGLSQAARQLQQDQQEKLWTDCCRTVVDPSFSAESWRLIGQRARR